MSSLLTKNPGMTARAGPGILVVLMISTGVNNMEYMELAAALIKTEAQRLLEKDEIIRAMSMQIHDLNTELDIQRNIVKELEQTIDFHERKHTNG